MTKCPKCGNHTVGYDSYRRVNRCLVDGCSCVVYNDNTFSYLEHSLNSIDRVRVKKDGFKEIIKSYKNI